MDSITDNAALAAFCNSVKGAPFIAVDTEFMRETTYWPKLCLIQAATPEHQAIIDPLADGLDLTPFLELLRDPARAPVLVLATINLAGAVLTEATLSFLGVGMPPTYPSLGTLIRIGNEFVFSGIWWIALFPALTLVILVLAVNVLGDWLRDRFNPKLRGRG